MKITWFGEKIVGETYGDWTRFKIGNEWMLFVTKCGKDYECFIDRPYGGIIQNGASSNTVQGVVDSIELMLLSIPGVGRK